MNFLEFMSYVFALIAIILALVGKFDRATYFMAFAIWIAM